jgi:enediyne polyketide synthase
MHAIQACVPERALLPIGVERIERFAAPGDSGGQGAAGGDAAWPLVVEAEEKQRGGGRYLYDLELREAGGCVLERWTGLALQEIRGAPDRVTWPAGLVAPYLESLSRLCFDPPERPELLGLRAALVAGDDRAASRRAVALAAPGGETLRHRPDGRPLLAFGEAAGAHSEAGVSLSHAAGHTLAVVARKPVACDIECIAPRAPELWRDMLGAERYRTAQRLADQLQEEFATAATRLWGAIECIRKGGLQRETPLLDASIPGERFVRLSAGEHMILSFNLALRGCGDSPLDTTPLVVSVLARGSDA